MGLSEDAQVGRETPVGADGFRNQIYQGPNNEVDAATTNLTSASPSKIVKRHDYRPCRPSGGSRSEGQASRFQSGRSMNPFERSIALELMQAFPSLQGAGLPPLTELKSKNGTHIYGFSIHTHESPPTKANLLILACDLKANPRFPESLPQPIEGLKSITLPVDGETYCQILKARMTRDYFFALCLSEAEAETFVRVMRWSRRAEAVPEFWDWQPAFQIDEATNKIIGAMTYDSALRSFYGAKELCEHWKNTFEGACPTEVGIGVVQYTEGLPFYRPDGTQVNLPSEQAIKHPALLKLSPAWAELGALFSGVREGEPERLAHWVPTGNDLAAPRAFIQTFCHNAFRLLHVAHRCIGGSFTSEFGSSLTTSNVDAEGWVHDLETFSMPRALTVGEGPKMRRVFGDEVPREQQLEDILLGVELIYFLTAKLGYGDLQVSLRLAYAEYAQGPVAMAAQLSELDSGAPERIVRVFADRLDQWRR